MRIAVDRPIYEVGDRREVQVRDRDYCVERFSIISMECVCRATVDVNRLSK